MRLRYLARSALLEQGDLYECMVPQIIAPEPSISSRFLQRIHLDGVISLTHIGCFHTVSFIR